MRETDIDIMQAIESRHSVRRYLDRPIEGVLADELEREVAAGTDSFTWA